MHGLDEGLSDTAASPPSAGASAYGGRARLHFRVSRQHGATGAMTRPVTILAALFAILILAAGRLCAAASEATDAGDSAGDPLAKAVEGYAGEGADYQQRIEEHAAAHAEGKQLTAEQARRYSNAYIHAGYASYRAGDMRTAAHRFGQAIAVDRQNALAYYCLGLLQRRYNGLKPAVDNLRAAGNLDRRLRNACSEQLKQIVQSVNEQAGALAGRGSFIEAARAYRFLADNFYGRVKEDALKRLKATEDEVAAERMLAEVRRKLSMGLRPEARKLLKELMTTYSWTRAGQTAKKLYRDTDSLEVKVRSESPAGEYAAREKWIDLETANCIVYYKNTESAKTVAKRVEETLKRVTDQLQYTKLDWHKEKCKVFVFDDADAWLEFVKNSGTSSEWAAGFAYGALREVYLHAGDPDDMLNRVLPHELTHVIHREYAGDEDVHLPLWLLEGLACHNQFAGKENLVALARSAVDSPHFIRLGRLTAMQNYPRNQTEINLFYAESLVLVEFIFDRFGHEGLVRLHKKLRYEDEFDKLIKRTFKMKVDEFENEWLKYVRTAGQRREN